MVLNHPTVYMNLPLPASNSRLTETQLRLILCFFSHLPLKFPISKAEKTYPHSHSWRFPKKKSFANWWKVVPLTFLNFSFQTKSLRGSKWREFGMSSIARSPRVISIFFFFFLSCNFSFYNKLELQLRWISVSINFCVSEMLNVVFIFSVWHRTTACMVCSHI